MCREDCDKKINKGTKAVCGGCKQKQIRTEAGWLPSGTSSKHAEAFSTKIQKLWLRRQ